jgi:hypothetical protein
MLRTIVASAILASALVGCKQPTGKDEYRRDTNLRNETLRNCANGTHLSSREYKCARCKDLDDLKRSL